MSKPRKRPLSKADQAMNASLERRGLIFTKASLGGSGATAADKFLKKRMGIYEMERKYS